MSNETLEVTREDVDFLSAVPAPTMTLIARTPAELRGEQQRLIAWCDAKRAEVRAEIAAVEEGIALHKSHKWGVGPLQRALRREQQRDLFYTKVKAALDAGFYIVPNFPSEIFAIRTNALPGGEGHSAYSRDSALRDMPTQRATVLPQGEGAYENPTPRGYVSGETEQRDGKAVTTWTAEVTEFAAMEFPFAFAKAEVLTATQQAMAMKLFDEFAVLPGRSKKVDPMIIGRIIRPWERKSWDTPQRHLSFLVVWWLDTNTI